ncbi:MAG: hypothetical protein AB7S26_40870 [Sandaracinaceae bacterium]
MDHFLRFSRHLLLLGAVVLLGLATVGCAAGAGPGLGLVVVLALGSLFAAGCSQSHSVDGDAGDVRIDAGTGDAGDGDWEPCCNAGRIESCFCPAGWACNYGWFETCSDGSCAYTGEMCPSDVDAGPPGTEEPCCIDGVITTCFCPADAECNYGWYNDCGGGTCVGPTDECPSDVDGGVPDGGVEGTWDPCCVDGVITSCFCPAGAICNYGVYDDCGGGTCATSGTMCP